MIRCVLIVAVMIGTIGRAQADTALEHTPQNVVQAPQWGVDLKAGNYHPDVDEWSTYYSDDKGLSAGLTLTRAVGPLFELVLDGYHFHDRGKGYYPANNQTGGSMLYELYTLGAGINIRLPVAAWGWLTPYAGVSAVRAFYNELINSSDNRRGYRDGALVRGGLRMLLDGIEPNAARVMEHDFGVINSLFVVEWQRVETDKVNGYDLGGETIYLGLRFEL